MGKNFAICIGINKYNNLQDLSYAKHDAELMRDYLVEEAGFEAYLFAEDAPPIKQDYGLPFEAVPSIGTLRRFLRVRFEKPFLSSGDNFWFFFAGHGLRHQGRDYLMPFDADPGDVDGTGISIYHITERLRRCGADNVVLMIDACRNQGRRNGVGVGTEEPKGIITVFSCSPDESSYEIDALQQGSFTNVLLTALRLQGEENCATVERLNKFLLDNVPALNQKYGKPTQTPYIVIEPATKLHLILLPEQATELDIATLREDAREAELEGDLEQAEHLWKRVLAIYHDDQSAWKGLKRIWSRTEITAKHPCDAGSRTGSVLPASSISKLRPQQLPTKPVLGASFSFEIVQVNSQGQEIERRQAEVVCQKEDLGNGIMLELVNIPGGSFMMGTFQGEKGRTKRERPQHEVKVSSFSMGRYPVTQAQWSVVSFLPKVNLELEANPARFKGNTYPVECISWHEAMEFCDRLSLYTGREYRLPSEAEWEYACRATTTTPFHFGETIRTSEANYHGDYIYGCGPVGKYRQSTNAVNEFSYANIFGLSDMHGNVFEWCQDIWHENYNGAPTDARAWIEAGDHASRVIRGGSWSSDPAACRSAYRSQAELDNRDDALGFRVVVSTS
ncbi:SUMF1/EgtB/PvdO family nonheme iron enzyme [Cyanobacteria bacterium FACHB-471]|nr:SUMF1/EgtB/PvdO family nonheme iron enzyme [Cyanobacteria bacterium FACHB-471]